MALNTQSTALRGRPCLPPRVEREQGQTTIPNPTASRQGSFRVTNPPREVQRQPVPRVYPKSVIDTPIPPHEKSSNYRPDSIWSLPEGNTQGTSPIRNSLSNQAHSEGITNTVHSDRTSSLPSHPFSTENGASCQSLGGQSPARFQNRTRAMVTPRPSRPAADNSTLRNVPPSSQPFPQQHFAGPCNARNSRYEGRPVEDTTRNRDGRRNGVERTFQQTYDSGLQQQQSAVMSGEGGHAGSFTGSQRSSIINHHDMGEPNSHFPRRSSHHSLPERNPEGDTHAYGTGISTLNTDNGFKLPRAQSYPNADLISAEYHDTKLQFLEENQQHADLHHPMRMVGPHEVQGIVGCVTGNNDERKDVMDPTAGENSMNYTCSSPIPFDDEFSMRDRSSSQSTGFDLRRAGKRYEEEGGLEDTKAFECEVDVWPYDPRDDKSGPMADKVTLLFDTQCQKANWVASSILQELGVEPVRLIREEELIAANGEPMKAHFKITLWFGNSRGGSSRRVESAEFLVFPTHDAPIHILLGADDCLRLNIIQRHRFYALAPKQLSPDEKRAQERRMAQHIRDVAKQERQVKKWIANREGQPLESQYKNVHADEKDTFPCDYVKCPRSKDHFARKDHLRDHLRDFHKEDIGCARVSRDKDERKGEIAQKVWLAERNISHKHWRCAKCLIKNYVAQSGWECLSCKARCENDRVRARQRFAPEEQTPKCPDETFAHSPLVCGAYTGSLWVEDGYGAYRLCPSCCPSGAHEFADDIVRYGTGGRGVPEQQRSEEYEDEDVANTLTVDLDPQVHEEEHIEQLSHPQTPKKTRSSSLVDLLSSAMAATLSLGSTTDTELTSNSHSIDVCERLVSLLWEDLELRLLFREGMQKTTLERCERNFRRSLMLCSVQLRTQASTSEEQQIARAIKHFATNAAHQFRSKMASQTESMKYTEHRSVEADNQINDLAIEDYEDNLDEVEESENDLDETEIKFQSLEKGFQGSDALLALKDNFRLFVHPNPVRKAMLEVWPSSHPRRSSHWISYLIKWELPEFLKKSFSKGQRLGDVMTITSQIEQGVEGELPNTQATSCRDYLSSNWPDIGTFLLDGLETLFDTVGPSQEPPTFQQIPKADQPHLVLIKKNQIQIRLELKGREAQDGELSTVYVTASASFEEQVQIALTLSWLCAALRRSRSREISFSRPIISANRSAFWQISLCPGILEPIIASKSCWSPLFQNAVIAHGFPISPRSEGRGLEISFPDLVLLSKSQALVQVQGGLVLDGLITLLYPVKKLLRDNAIQWHLELKTTGADSDEDGQRFIHASEVMATSAMQEWHKELDPQKLVTSRLFLGWTSEANVVLGTQSTFASMVNNSGAFDSESTRCVKTYGGSAGIGFHGIASISAHISATRSAVASGISGIESKEDNAVILWLSNGIKNHIILYDDDKETGWLIAQTTLFLFLLQVFVMRRPGGLRVLPPELLSIPAHDGGQAAFKTLSRFKEQDHSDEDHYWEMVKETCHHLFNVSHELRQIYTDARKAYDVAPSSILGVELVDVALKEASMPVKKANVFNPWAHLAEHQPCIVLLCKDLGQVIVPSSLDGLCSGWRSVPHGCKYLVATGPSILYMLHKRTRKEVSRLADNIDWEFEVPIIGSHRTRTQIRCCHLQSLKSEVPQADRKGLLQAVQACENGGYIFTGSSKLRKFPLCRPMLAECAKIKNSAPTKRMNKRNQPIPIGTFDQMRPSLEEAISYGNSSMIGEDLGERGHDEPESTTIDTIDHAQHQQAAPRAHNMVTNPTEFYTKENESPAEGSRGQSSQQTIKRCRESDSRPSPDLQLRNLQYKPAVNRLFPSASHAKELTEETWNVKNDASSDRTVRANNTLRHVPGKESLRA